MAQLLFVLSFLGVLQGFILAFIFYIKRKQNEHNTRLAVLFAFFSFILLLITVSGRVSGNFYFLFEFIEFGATFLAGPLIYLFAIELLDRSQPLGKSLALHFAPFVVYVAYQSLSSGVAVLPEIPIVVPLLHFQLYTLWLVKTVVQQDLFRAIGKEQPGEWLVLIAALLVGLHVAQWMRYIFSGVEQLSLLVPTVGFGGFYLLSAYGLLKSRLFIFAKKYKNISQPDDELAAYKEKLLRLFEEQEIHTQPELTIEHLGSEMGISPHIVSHLINDSFGANFNAFVNRYRVASAKRYLKDPANQCYTIEALAEKAGFNSRSSFYSAFRNVTGTTPSAYRD